MLIIWLCQLRSPSLQLQINQSWCQEPILTLWQCRRRKKVVAGRRRLWWLWKRKTTDTWRLLLETETDWDKFIQHNMTLYRCMISDIHDSSYVLFNTNLISNTSLHVGRPLLRPFLVANAEVTLVRQKKIAQQTKSDDIISEYLLRTNGQLFEMNVKIVSSYWQAGKAVDPLQHD